ncbi:MAG TPA: hypothetical protein VKR30_01795 [Candidatus Limnocylindrales bacterium]|nr:hypothetical protein [Candidatus Limnocylindrales bacterium]
MTPRTGRCGGREQIVEPGVSRRMDGSATIDATALLAIILGYLAVGAVWLILALHTNRRD